MYSWFAAAFLLFLEAFRAVHARTYVKVFGGAVIKVVVISYIKAFYLQHTARVGFLFGVAFILLLLCHDFYQIIKN